jgi:hypothetical protein
LNLLEIGLGVLLWQACSRLQEQLRQDERMTTEMLKMRKRQLNVIKFSYLAQMVL